MELICPECGAEYREGFYSCADCEVDLVTEEPPPLAGIADPGLDLVTAFRASDPGRISLAESLLQDMGISYLVRGDGLQDLFGGGRLGGFNPVVGPAEVQVAMKDAEAARKLLNPLMEEMEEESAHLSDAEVLGDVDGEL